MNKTYRVYFNLKNQFRSVHDAEDSFDLNEVVTLLDKISENEYISVYYNEIKLRMQIWGHSNKNKCVLEIHDGHKGTCFSKELEKSELKNEPERLLEKYIENPLQYGFNAESF